MSADLIHILVYVLAGGILGVSTVLVLGRMIPGMIDRLTPNIDEQKEIVRGNQAVAQFFGLVSGAVIIGVSIVLAAGVLGGIQSGAGILKPINLTPQVYTPIYTNAPASSATDSTN